MKIPDLHLKPVKFPPSQQAVCFEESIFRSERAAASEFSHRNHRFGLKAGFLSNAEIEMYEEAAALLLFLCGTKVNPVILCVI